MEKIRLWLIGYDAPVSGRNLPKVVMQCDREPTEREAESAVYDATYGGTVYVESITETSESEMRGKQYYLVGAKQ